MLTPISYPFRRNILTNIGCRNEINNYIFLFYEWKGNGGILRSYFSVIFTNALIDTFPSVFLCLFLEVERILNNLSTKDPYLS